MALEYDDVSRFTPEQRDEILNLAARLQVDHEATISAHDLARDAAEAGIDPRFVQEAARRLGRKSRSNSSFRGPIVAFVLLAIQAYHLMFVAHLWERRQGVGLDGSELVYGCAVSFLLSLWAAQNLALRRFVPAVTLATWAVVGLTAFVVEGQLIAEGPYFWVIPTMILFGLAETIASSVAVLVRTVAEREPRRVRDFGGTRA